jgi:hypothetical protein
MKSAPQFGRLRAAALALLGVMATSTTGAAGDDVKLKVERPVAGLELKAGEKTFVYFDGSIVFTIQYAIAPSNRRLRLALPNSDSGGSSLARFFVEQRPLAILNGGFLATYAPATPAGLVQIRGERINEGGPRDQVASAVICFGQTGKPNAIAIEPFSAAERLQKAYSDCLQAGPLLIYKSHPVSGLEELDNDPTLKNFAFVAAERSFIARNGRGEIVLGVTAKTSLYALQAALMLGENEGGFGATAAICLTGRSTAGMIVAGKEPYTAGAISKVLPNAIIVTP